MGLKGTANKDMDNQDMVLKGTANKDMDNQDMVLMDLKVMDNKDTVGIKNIQLMFESRVYILFIYFNNY